MNTAQANMYSVDSIRTTSIIGFVLAFLIPPAGIVVSAIAKRDAKRAGIENGFATYGFMISIALTAIPALMLIVTLLTTVISTVSANS